jgi:hypothetical protein
MAPSMKRVRQASDDLIDSFRGSRTTMTVIAFGTSAYRVAANVAVADKTSRGQLKHDVDALDSLDDNAGGTNWEGALQAASLTSPNLVVMLTDGDPTVYGSPAVQATDLTDAVAPATAWADRLKRQGTRVVLLGIGLDHGTAQTLPLISGPTVGDDYYLTDPDGLLHQLYDVSSKACGIPIAALPKPEPAAFPLKKVILGALAGLLALLGIGLVAGRRRGRSTPPRAAASKPSRPLPTSTISAAAVDEEMKRVRQETSSSRADATGDDATGSTVPPAPAGHSRNSISLDFLKDSDDRRP